ncbi:hypothetical protein WN51_13700 [Melipona quadrifasciata]|uniref:Uncharacterized protein n=1 Tax=Melipona quadrifasciata TaxID=166423 RepID=A0A0M9A0X9_9HYME|nr:hypothetical protein WN51_13700 [Melipona quadrifasciata]
MGEAACSPSCAGRLCGRQPCATVLVVQEVHHHRHQRLRRHLPPKKQRLLPTLTWQMSVTPATKPEIQGPAGKDRCRSSRRSQKERAPQSSVTSPEGDRPTPQATPGRSVQRCPAVTLGKDWAAPRRGTASEARFRQTRGTDVPCPPRRGDVSGRKTGGHTEDTSMADQTRDSVDSPLGLQDRRPNQRTTPQLLATKVLFSSLSVVDV